MVAWVLTAACWSGAAGDLPADLKKELARIEAKIEAIAAAAGASDRAAVEQSLREVETWIRDFALDAELSERDPIIERLRASSKEIARVAVAREKRMAAQAAKAKSSLAKPEAMPAVKPAVDMNNVSFKRDVAPILANVCARCHNANNASGQFDATTYTSFKAQLVPGKPDDSHVLKLVTGKAEPAMPRGGQTRFSKEWADTWAAWIRQGAKFDGPNPDAPIATYLIDFEAQRRESIAKMPVDDLARLRRSQAQRQIGIARPNRAARFIESPHLLIHAAMATAEAEYVATLAEATIEELAKRFGAETVAATMRGKFALFVFDERADFVAFCNTVDRYSPEPADYGHVVLSLEDRHASIWVDRQSDQVDERVAEFVALGFLRQLGQGQLPPWASHGYAKFLARSLDDRGSGTRRTNARLTQLLADKSVAANLFAERLPWSDLETLAVGFFEFAQRADRKRVRAFIESMAQHGNATRAAQETWNVSVDELANRWRASAKTKAARGR